jgi:hypothetical protein
LAADPASLTRRLPLNLLHDAGGHLPMSLVLVRSRISPQAGMH